MYKTICSSIFLICSALPALAGITLPAFCQPDDRFITVENNRDNKRIFIETGTAGGHGVFMAFNAGFEEIHSIELLREELELAKQRIGNRPDVHLYLGDSATTLYSILPTIKEPVLFWLDAHFGDRVSDNCPILKELAAIASHPIKTHTILIDDVRCFGKSVYDYITIDEVVKAVKEINPAYEISFQDGYEKKDVLVAKIAP